MSKLTWRDLITHVSNATILHNKTVHDTHVGFAVSAAICRKIALQNAKNKIHTHIIIILFIVVKVGSIENRVEMQIKQVRVITSRMMTNKKTEHRERTCNPGYIVYVRQGVQYIVGKTLYYR